MIATVGNDQNDVLEWFRYPKMRYEEQIELLLADLKRKRKRKKLISNGPVVEEELDYFSRIVGVRGGFYGLRRLPNGIPAEQQRAPIGTDSQVKFTIQSKHEMYTKWEDALFREVGDPMVQLPG